MKNNNESNLFEQLGIKLDDGKIEIDTNKAKTFFESLQETLEKKVEDISKNAKEGAIDLKDSVGLKVENEKIELDLTKTKSFLENIANKAKEFVESLDSEVKKITKK